MWVDHMPNTFLTLSYDGYILLWNYINDKWRPKILDVSSATSAELSTRFYHERNGLAGGRDNFGLGNNDPRHMKKTEAQIINKNSANL
jgi:hypothetical protein